MCLAALALAGPSQAASGTWERAWGENVNGGGVFGVCTVAPNCLAGTDGGVGGAMKFPIGVATDSAGNVYVADAFNNRIQKFDSSGTWERAWGKGVNGGSAFGVCTVAASCLAGQAGGMGGEMNAPYGVATDSGGNVYVAELNSNRIQKFDSSGTWERAWGKGVNGGSAFGVCTVAASCLAGADGTLGGEMNTPYSVATDSLGNVYLADPVINRIQKFDSSGTWERAWGKGVNGGSAFGVCTVATSCLAGQSGGLGGEMFAPSGVATDSGGNVYVAEQGIFGSGPPGNRIQKFDSSGTWERAWGKGVTGGSAFGVCTVAANCLGGSPGGLGGEMYSPNGVATHLGNVYVADTINNRIQKFDSSGTWERAWGKGVTGGSAFGVCTVAASCLAGTVGARGCEMINPFRVATDVAGNVYVSDGTSNNRIQKFADPPVPPATPFNCGASSGPPPTTPPTTPTPTSAGTAQGAPSAEALCSRRLISLVRADVKKGRVVLHGLVSPRLAGRPVAIFANYTRSRRSALKRLASVRSNAAGQFTARLRPPPRKFFGKVRYEARIGRVRSPQLKLHQSLASNSIKAAGGQIELRGKVKRALLGRRNPVVIKRLLCGRYKTVASVKPAANGNYVARFAAPTGVEAALYRAESRVLAKRGSRRHVKQYARAILIVLTQQSG